MSTNELPVGFTEAWRREERLLTAERLRWGFGIGVPLYIAFYCLDLLIVPEQHLNFLLIRVLTVIAPLLAVALSFSERGKRHALVLSFIGMVSVAGGVAWLSMLVGPADNHYYVGNILVLFFAGGLLPWALGVNVAFCATLITAFFALNPLAATPLSFLLAASLFNCVVSELSHRLRKRELISRLRLEAANVDLRKLDEAKSRFFSNVSHELRTPLMLILGPLEALKEKPDTDPRPLLDTLRQNAQRLLRQVNMILDFSKLDAGRMRPNIQSASLGAIAAGLVKAAQPFAATRGVSLEGDASLQSIPLSELDPAQVETVVANLVSNAVKFTKSGGRVVVGGRFDKDNVELSVEDDGPGIPKAEIKAIFDRFHQIEGEHRPEGTGLGLAMVKELVEQHRGTINVESELGHGATFSISLPRLAVAGNERRQAPRRREDRAMLAHMDTLLAKDLEALPRAASLLADLQTSTLAAEQTETKPTPQDAPKILVVEDNPDLRAFIRSCLEADFVVETAPDGQAGLEQLHRFAPDLVLSDVSMPRMDGHTLCARIKADPLFSLTPVILLTAHTGADAAADGLNMGADDYVGKPFDLRELRARIHSQLRARSIERKLHERESRLAAVGQFTATIAHDLRSPLQAIIGHGELARMLVKRDNTNAPALADLDAMDAAAVRAELMIQKMLDYARSGSLRLQTKPLDASAFLSDISATMEPLLARAGVSFVSALTLRSGSELHADPVHLRRIVENLVSNARDVLVQQKPPHASPTVWLSAEETEERISISVADNGPGIPPEVADRLFQPFTTAKKHGGTGLGLSIVSNLAKAHGGSVRANARAEAGTVFVVDLPRRVAEDLKPTATHHL